MTITLPDGTEIDVKVVFSTEPFHESPSATDITQYVVLEELEEP